MPVPAPAAMPTPTAPISCMALKRSTEPTRAAPTASAAASCPPLPPTMSCTVSSGASKVVSVVAMRDLRAGQHGRHGERHDGEPRASRHSKRSWPPPAGIEFAAALIVPLPGSPVPACLFPRLRPAFPDRGLGGGGAGGVRGRQPPGALPCRRPRSTCAAASWPRRRGPRADSAPARRSAGIPARRPTPGSGPACASTGPRCAAASRVLR